jgi:LPS sulfotransferase NodH
MTPERSYLVCATPRSGSTLVCQALKASEIRLGTEFDLVPATPQPA